MSYTNASRFGKRYMFLAFEIWLQSYIRPLMQTISLLALMELKGLLSKIFPTQGDGNFVC